MTDPYLSKKERKVLEHLLMGVHNRIGFVPRSGYRYPNGRKMKRATDAALGRLLVFCLDCGLNVDGGKGDSSTKYNLEKFAKMGCKTVVMRSPSKRQVILIDMVTRVRTAFYSKDILAIIAR